MQQRSMLTCTCSFTTFDAIKRKYGGPKYNLQHIHIHVGSTVVCLPKVDSREFRICPFLFKKLISIFML